MQSKFALFGAKKNAQKSHQSDAINFNFLSGFVETWLACKDSPPVGGMMFEATHDTLID